MIGGAAGWLSAGLAPGLALGGAEEHAAAAAAPGTLSGKRALIQRSSRPPNFETPPAGLVPLLTSNDEFFVRYHLPVIPPVDPATWRLEVGGLATGRPLSLSLHDLRHRFEKVSVVAVNQCSGNRRGLFAPRVPGVQWGNGAMGNARWSGVRLRDVLRLAGVSGKALEVVYGGSDAGALPATPAFVKSLPIDRALDEWTLVCFEMNGEPLPRWNGAPVRLVVPGWTGTYWMKHLDRIRVVEQPFEGFWMKSAYRLPTGKFPGARFASQETPETTPITAILVNSLITSPAAGARLARGEPASVRGKAWDGGSGIAAVEVSLDGASWREATLGVDLGPYAWREFTLPVDTSSPGRIDIAVRARARNGAVQPEALVPNPSGYHDNRVQRVSVEVA